MSSWRQRTHRRAAFILLGLASLAAAPGPVKGEALSAFPEEVGGWNQAFKPSEEDDQPELWLALSGCDPSPVEGACAHLPDLLIQFDGDDPTAYVIHVTLGDEKIACPAPTCAVELLQTSSDGIDVTFWVESLYDESKASYTAHLRVLPTGQGADDETPAWYVQVLSTHWRGGPADACAIFWDTFLPVSGLPSWLRTPDVPDGLASNVVYHYLASKLIAAGGIDVSECSDGGLTEDGAPSACGAAKATPIVQAWQNQFDEAILNAARAALVPAALTKRVIAQESQFWPGTILERGEYGLGHLTEQGADNTFLWNKDFYTDYCPSVLGEAYCGGGYSHQSEYRKGLMRGSLLSGMDADCRSCQWGVDLDVAREGIRVLAETISAYCSQTGRMVSNVTREAPGRGTSFEDMWKLTLASYSAGPGCVADALKAAWRKRELISWSSVSDEFANECSGAVDYIDHVAR